MIGRKRTALVAFAALAVGAILLVTTSAGASIRADIYIGHADMAVSGQALPLPVSAGKAVAFDITTVNNGPFDAGGVQLNVTLPGGSTFVSAQPGQGGCLPSAGTVLCSIGIVPVGAQVTTRVVVRSPDAPGSLVLGARVSASKRDFNTNNNRTSVLATVANLSQDFVAEFVLPAGGTVSTGSGASRLNPQTTHVKVPPSLGGAAISVTETTTSNPAAQCGNGFVCAGQIVTLGVAGNTFSYTKPLKMTMVLDKSEVLGINGAKMPVFRNRSLISNCFSGGIAKPDPCVASRTVTSSGDVKIVVLTTLSGKYRA